ncbi:MAG: hypothetical protein KKH02_05335 [Proteobacteria bacterium]|nr:hypothetical protein [Pseudomonadota bacterium]MBU4372059.1 hypothetical protein [Pseudomonadota bacterium]MBU4581827.1 hypothetical protein [Pseudomonadota bacterium]MCG2739309.1 hypothetical protein [Syntrophaceae bacterium]
MKKIFCLVVIVAELIVLSVAPALAKFPERPINIVVYLKPGGLEEVPEGVGGLKEITPPQVLSFSLLRAGSSGGIFGICRSC